MRIYNILQKIQDVNIKSHKVYGIRRNNMSYLSNYI